MRTLRVLSTLLLLGTPSLAHATSVHIMTFDELPTAPPFSNTWIEDGITATAAGMIFPLSDPDSVHLDRAEAWPYRIDFTTGSLFDPVSVDIRPAGSGYCSPGGCTGSGWDPIDYIWVIGFVGDLEVSSLGFYRPPDRAFETISLDHFPTIDRLRVEPRTYLDLGLPGNCFTSAGCGHFNLDNVTLRAVSPAIPEPGALAVFAVGLLCVSYARAPRGRFVKYD